MNRSLTRSLLVALLIAVVSAGCAQQGERERPLTESVEPDVAPVWPPPPAEPRIRYLRSLTGPDQLSPERGLLEQFLGVLKGSRPQRISQPLGLDVDADGRLYVTDTVLAQVHVFDLAAQRYLRFPSPPPARFRTPVDVVAGVDGRVFVSDSGSGLVHVFTAPGYRHLASFGEDQIDRPTGMALTRDGDLIVVDTVGSRLAVYDPRTLLLKRVVGRLGKDERSFNRPTQVATGRDGRIYVVDSLNFRVQILDSEYRFVGRFGLAGDTPGHFARPKGIAVDSEGNIYVVDAIFDNVQVFDPQGRLLIAFGSPGRGAGEFWLPADIRIDDRDRIYVADAYNQRVQVFARVGRSGRTR